MPRQGSPCSGTAPSATLARIARCESGGNPRAVGGPGGMYRGKAWRDIWGCGQGIGAVSEIVGAAELIDRIAREYEEARRHLAA
jgi:NAD(P)H-dependent flavin oxidoreductase YrpB (nitropropane dioxygenase family)